MRHKDSSLDISMSEIGLDDHAQLGAVPSSFATQMALATNMANLKRSKGEESADGMMGRLMLARMKTLEEGFAEVVKEFRGMGMRTAGNSSVENEPSLGKRRDGKAGDKKKTKRPGTGNPSIARSEVDVQGRAQSSKGKERANLDDGHGDMPGDVDVGVGVDIDVTGMSRDTMAYETPFQTPLETAEGDVLDKYLTKGNSL